MARDRQRLLEQAERIRQLRGPKPQPVVATAIDVELRTYQHWEEGHGISWENLQKLAAYHGVSENFVLYGAEAPSGPVSQLDRMEGMLLEILSRLPADDRAEIEAETEARARQSEQSDAASSEKARGRRRKAR